MRCLPYLLIISAVLFCSTAFAKTPDGETPAEESECDEVKWATPGLYGLCVAFCEAQDCEPDFTLVNPFENCKPASRKILDNYRKKMRPSDPDMPCLQEPCPCWSRDELDMLWPPLPNDYTYCNINVQIGPLADNLDSFASFHSAWMYSLVTLLYIRAVPPEPICQFDYHTEGVDIERFYVITHEEFLICEEQLNQKGAELGYECFLP